MTIGKSWRDRVLRASAAKLPKGSDASLTRFPWLSPAKYRQFHTVTLQHAQASRANYRWNAEQAHDAVLFMTDAELYPGEAITSR